MPKSKEKIKSSLLIFHEYQFETNQQSDKKNNKSKEKQRTKVQGKKQTIDLKNTSRSSFKKAVNKFKQLFQQKIQKQMNIDQSKTLPIKEYSDVKIKREKQKKSINYKTQKLQNEKNQNKLKGPTRGLTELFNQMEQKLQNYKNKLNQNKQQKVHKQKKFINSQGKTGLVKSKTIKQLQKQKQPFNQKHYLPNKASKTFSQRDQKTNNTKSLYSIKKNKDFISYSLLNSSNKKHDQSKLVIKYKKSITDQINSNNKTKSKEKLAKSKQKLAKSKQKQKLVKSKQKQKLIKSKQKIINKSTQLKKKRVLTDIDLKKQQQKPLYISQNQLQQQTENNSNIYAYLIQEKYQDLSDSKQNKDNQENQQKYNNFEYIQQFSPKKLSFQNQILKSKQITILQQNISRKQQQYVQINQAQTTIQKYIKTFCLLTKQNQQKKPKKQLKQQKKTNKLQSNSLDIKFEVNNPRNINFHLNDSKNNNFHLNDSKNNNFYLNDSKNKNFHLNEVVSNIKLTPTKSIKLQTQCHSGDKYFFKMMKEQQEKWLKLKQDLDNLKQAQNKTQFLQTLIKEVNKNHSLLQNIKIQAISPQIIKQRTFFNNNHQKQQKYIKHSKYQEAPINVKWLMNKPSSQDAYKESQRLSMELSQKKLLEDIDLMNFISNNRSSRSLLFESNLKSDNIQEQLEKNQIQEIKIIQNQESLSKYNRQQKSQSQELLISGFSSQKRQRQKQNIQTYIQPQNCSREFKIYEQFQSSELQLNGLILKQNLKNFQQGKNIHQQKQLWTKISQQNNFINQIQDKFNQNQLKGLNKLSQEFKLQKFDQQCFQSIQQKQQKKQVSQQNQDSQQNGNDSQNKIVEAFNKNKKQMLYSLVFQSLMNQYAIDLVKSNRLTYFVVDSFNKNVVQIHKYDQFKQPQSQNIGIPFQQDNFIDQKIKSDKLYIQLYAKQLLQYSLQDQEVNKRLNIPIGIKPLQCIKYMRYLERQTDQDEEEFVINNEEYQNIISLQNIYSFQNVFDSEMNNNQQEFNQSICDSINNLLDYFRPFGKKGWPPICFKFKYNRLLSGQIKQIVLKQMNKILQIKLGIINFNVQPWEIQKILRQSLTKFSESCVQQFQEQLIKLEQIVFQIQFQLMNQIQNDIFFLFSWEIYQFLQSKNKLQN